jgi:hypothetical protein
LKSSAMWKPALWNPGRPDAAQSASPSPR